MMLGFLMGGGLALVDQTEKDSRGWTPFIFKCINKQQNELFMSY